MNILIHNNAKGIILKIQHFTNVKKPHLLINTLKILKKEQIDYNIIYLMFTNKENM